MFKLLPGLNHFYERAGDVTAEDAKGDEAPEADLIAHHQEDAHTNNHKAVEVVDEAGHIGQRFACDFKFEVFANEAGVAILELPAGFQFGVLGLDRLNASDGFIQIGIGFHGLAHAPVDLGAHQWVAEHGEHQHQGQCGQGGQGERNAEGEKDGQIEEAE